MELTELAKDPQAFDTKLAELHRKHAQLVAMLHAVEESAHRAAGDKREYLGRRPVWRMSLADALAKAPVKAEARDALLHDMAEVQAEMRAMDEAYTGWSRFFPSVTKSQPHIHCSLTCRTLHADTVMTWAPQMSGTTEAEAVAELDEALCSVCFPTAPVALHEYASKRSQAERAERETAKAVRGAAKAAKTLTEDEQFRDSDGDLVTTVAACKALIREAVEAHIEALWAATPAATKAWTDPDMLTRMRANRVRRAIKLGEDSELAARVLMARARRQPGTGATADEIARMRASKEKSARKEWLG